MILVTGGTGFVGSNIALGFAADGHDVAICDTFGTAEKWRNLETLTPRAIMAPGEVFSWLDENASIVTAIVHMGAISSTTEQDVDLIVRVNFDLPQRLWRWCAQAGIPLIYASSAATYGDGSKGFDDNDSPEHLAALRPLNPYGWSKNLFDKWAANEARHGATPPRWHGLKFFNVYGPHEDHKQDMRSVVTQFYPGAARGEPIRLFKSGDPKYADGGQLRDFVYVRDCVAIVKWMLTGAPPSGIYNVGTGQARTFLDLAKAVFAALRLPEKIEFADFPAHLHGKYQYVTQANMAKLRTAGYGMPLTSLEDGVADYLTRLR